MPNDELVPLPLSGLTGNHLRLGHTGNNLFADRGPVMVCVYYG